MNVPLALLRRLRAAARAASPATALAMVPAVLLAVLLALLSGLALAGLLSIGPAHAGPPTAPGSEAAIEGGSEAGSELVMFQAPGCVWCRRWEAEIGGAYAGSDAGRTAPLRRVDMEAPLPDDLHGIETVRFSPTFVLLNDGTEVGRIVGYPGEHFFWPLLEELLARLPSAGTAAAREN